MFKKIGLTILAIAGFILSFGSEGAYETTLTNQTEDRPSVTMSHNSWDDGISTTAVLANVLEDEGFEVEFVQLDPAILVNSIANNESDISVVPWAVTHQAYLDEYEGQFENLGPHALGAANGIVVPEYMEEVNHVKDLIDQADKTFTSIEPGAVIVEQAQTAIETYDNLSDWEVQTSSTGAMLTALGKAYKNEEDIVLTGWTPHWKFVEYDLKILKEPEETFKIDNIIKIARKDFEEDNPIAYEILDNFSWSVEDIQQVMTYLQDENMTASEAARKWMDENPEKVAAWTEGVEGL